MAGPREPGLRADAGIVLRTPLLPLTELEAWARAADPRAHLMTLLDRADVDEAIFVASPSLHDAIDPWRRAPRSASGQRTELALCKYVARMCGRATPFGLFAGVSTGRLGATTRITLAPRIERRRHTRLDNDYLFVLAETLAATPEARAALRYRPSTSIYRLGGRLRYAAARLEGKERSYHLISVEPTAYLDNTLRRAQHGALLAELAATLAEDDPEVTLDDAQAYVAELVDAQLLVPELGVFVTGAEPVDGLLAQLDAARLAEPRATLLLVRSALAVIDGGGVGVAPERYRKIAEQLGALPVGVEPSRLFQVDAVTPAEVEVGVRVAADVAKAIGILRSISARPPSNSLDDFRAAFTARYESRAVPLVEVLDEESGIGFEVATGPGAEGSPLLEGLAFPAPRRVRTLAWSNVDAHVVRRLAEVLASNAEELVLDEADLTAMKSDAPQRLPDALCAMVRLAGTRAQLEAGDLTVLLEGVSGPSGANLLGRFCHASPEIHALVEAHLRAEEALRPEALFAEIVHLNEGRIGNILCRPVLRGHEIVFLGRSGAAEDRQITIDDLIVTVLGERIVLTSRRLGREIVPRLTTAHNFRLQSLGVYRFLCALASQDGRGVGWSWGAFADAPRLPRVRVGRVVLARATWALIERDLAPLAAASREARRTGVREIVADAVQALRARLALPRFVAIAEADNELPIDLDNPLLVDAFADELTGSSRARVIELFPAPDRLIADGDDGAYSHELIMTFVNPAARVPSVSMPAPPRAVRSFPPGSEWLYAKLYCGVSTADRVLREVVAPVVRGAFAQGDLRQWFFLRYADPDPHLRLRIAGVPEVLTARVLPALMAGLRPLLDVGAVRRVVLDTYDRELERYGGDAGVEACERAFWIDSEAVLEIVELLDGDAGNAARWRLAIRGIEGILTALNLDASTRERVLELGRDSLFAEHRGDGDFGGRLSARFKRDRADLERVFASDPTHPLAPGLEILARRDARLADVGAALHAEPSLPEIAWSLIHMHANRLLHASQRAQELVLYDYLGRLYASRRARAR